MQAKQIVARVEELVKPLCEQAGVSLWDVEFEKEGGQYMLTVTVDRPEGVNIDQCEQVSRALDPMLDEKEFEYHPVLRDRLVLVTANAERFQELPEDAGLELLQQEDTLQEVVRLVGQDALSGADRLTLETAKMLREDFLQQNAFVSEDAYTPLAQQARLLELILCYDTLCRAAIEQGNAAQALFALPVRETLARAKMAPGETWAQQYAALERQMRQQIAEQTREEELTL